MTRTHFVLDAAGNRVSEIVCVLIFHLFGECDQGFDRFAHGRYFFVGASTAFTVSTFIGAFSGTGNKFH